MNTYKLCVSYGQEQLPTHFVPVGEKSNVSQDITQKNISSDEQTHVCTLTVEVSLSRAFI